MEPTAESLWWTTIDAGEVDMSMVFKGAGWALPCVEDFRCAWIQVQEESDMRSCAFRTHEG